MQRKKELEERLAEVRAELSNIENTFPKELQGLRQRIQQAKQETEEYEGKTKALANELRELKAKAASGNTPADAQGAAAASGSGLM